MRDVQRACREAVRALMQQYQWRLLSEFDLTARILPTIPTNASQQEISGAVKHHYALALYEACSSSGSSREQGYTELHRYLLRLAYRFWPGHPEDFYDDVAQRALLIVFEKISTCEFPAAFFTFARYKLLQANKEEIRARRPEENHPLDDDFFPSADDSFINEEQTQLLLEAIAALKNEQEQLAVFYRYFAGLSDKEIAARLGIKPGYVAVLRSRALKKLRRDPRLAA